ncbi:MAG: hypothetical protein CM1200mP34_2710 [Verrucomicrobiales bacterium]|nr:MAG: hypothetical protein CM1200mP34_2710 [Verrucomicrobiales bacterium]
MGLVPQVFRGKALASLKGSMAVGHTRYSTTGSSHHRNSQPLTVDCSKGQIAIAHNGNLTNAAQLREELELNGSIFQTTVDSEIILHLMARPTNGSENNLVQSLQRIQGAYSLVLMTENELIGVRDPHGFRPLSIGKLDGAYVLSSETCAFDLIQAEFVRDVEPGEIVVINDDGIQSIRPSRCRSAGLSAFLSMFISAGLTRLYPTGAFTACVSTWAGRWPRKPPLRPTSSCRCRTAATAPRWATRSSPACRTRWRSCATPTSAGVSCSRRSSSATSTCA